jgi:integrase/recombinase XerC
MSADLVPIRAAPHSVRGARKVLQLWLAGRNPQTTRAYMSDLKDFADFLRLPDEAHAVDMLLAGDPGRANRIALLYRADLFERRGLASATIARRLAALRSLARLARTAGIIDWAIDVPSPRVTPYRDTRGPGRDGWRAIRAAAGESTRFDQDGRLAKRNLALVLLLHDMALRRGEVAALDLDDVELGTGDHSQCRLRITGKGRTEPEYLTVGSAPARAALAAWIAGRGSEPGPLFPRLDRAGDPEQLQRMTGHSIGRLVGTLSDRAGLDRRARAHGLRHAGITRALKLTGGNVPMVQRLSRHADPKTLLIYNDAREDLAGRVSQLLGADD